MTVLPASEDQLSGPGMALPQVDDVNDADNTSDSSEDDEEEIKGLCAKMPFDFGFTLIGMNVRQSDFRTLRKLRMDLDTFLTLSDKELLDLGVKQSSNIKKAISDNSNVMDCFNNFNCFWKPKIKDLRISSDESCTLMKNIFAHIETVRKFLQELQFLLLTDPPVNYAVTKEYTSAYIFGRSIVSAMILAEELRQELKYLAGKCDQSQDEAWDKAKRGKLETDTELDRTDSMVGHTEADACALGKVQSSNKLLICAKSTLVVTSSGLSIYGLWKLWDFIVSNKT